MDLFLIFDYATVAGELCIVCFTFCFTINFDTHSRTFPQPSPHIEFTFFSINI